MNGQRMLIGITAVLAMLLLGAGSGWAATYTWDGGGPDGNFSTDANWVGDVDLSAVLGAGDTIEFPDFNYAGDQQPVCDEATTCLNITFNTTSSAITLTLNNAAIIVATAGIIQFVTAGGGNAVTIT